ncbi:MAG: glycosyltransferase [Bacteroidales bacterium]|nr:glycosyltransferase [Candidatus Colimorpha pelethequi]
MKIIVLGTAHPYRGGLAAFNERLAHQFVEEGHEVEMITFTLQYPGFLFPGKTQFTDAPAPKSLSISRKVNSCNPFNWLKVGKTIRKKNPDLVIFAYWMSFFAPCYGTIARQIRKNHHTKCIGLIHNMIPHEPNILDKLFPGYFVGAMDGFTALSDSVVHDIEKFDHKATPKRFSPHPIYDHYGALIPKNEAIQLLQLDPNFKYVLFFGFIRGYKGLDLLLEAFADRRLQDLGVKLVVAGEFYGSPKPYMDQIDSLKIADRVVLKTDYIPDEEVNRYFRACDIVAQPYKSATQSGVTQIAFHFEKPMLVTNVGGLPEIVPNGKIGYVVEPYALQIADALVAYYQEDKETTFIENVKEEKKKYAWDKMTATILSVYADSRV